MQEVSGWIARISPCALLLAGVAVAEEPAERTPPPPNPALAGYWSGSIEVPGRPIPVSVNLAQAGSDWAAKVDIPSQGIRRVDMTGVRVAGDEATFQIPGVPGNPTFQGDLTDDTSAIAGNFTQGGQTFPFRLERAEKPEDYDVDVYADYRKPGLKGEGVAGEWLSLLETGPHRLRMKLDVEAGAEGAYSGTLVSVDQNGATIDAENFMVDGKNVSFSLSRIGASFEGTLSDDGSTIEGTWMQGGQRLPMTLRRAG